MIETNNCNGCQACIDICSFHAISFEYDIWGEGKAVIDNRKCKKCNKCDSICPACVQDTNQAQENVFAVVSNNNSKSGSSEGFFYEIASQFIKAGGIVYGAAFDADLKLKHP